MQFRIFALLLYYVSGSVIYYTTDTEGNEFSVTDEQLQNFNSACSVKDAKQRLESVASTLKPIMHWVLLAKNDERPVHLIKACLEQQRFFKYFDTFKLLASSEPVLDLSVLNSKERRKLFLDNRSFAIFIDPTSFEYIQFIDHLIAGRFSECTQLILEHPECLRPHFKPKLNILHAALTNEFNKNFSSHLQSYINYLLNETEYKEIPEPLKLLLANGSETDVSNYELAKNLVRKNENPSLAFYMIKEANSRYLDDTLRVLHQANPNFDYDVLERLATACKVNNMTQITDAVQYCKMIYTPGFDLSDAVDFLCKNDNVEGLKLLESELGFRPEHHEVVDCIGYPEISMAEYLLPKYGNEQILRESIKLSLEYERKDLLTFIFTRFPDITQEYLLRLLNANRLAEKGEEGYDKARDRVLKIKSLLGDEFSSQFVPCYMHILKSWTKARITTNLVNDMVAVAISDNNLDILGQMRLRSLAGSDTALELISALHQREIKLLFTEAINSSNELVLELLAPYVEYESMRLIETPKLIEVLGNPLIQLRMDALMKKAYTSSNLLLFKIIVKRFGWGCLNEDHITLYSLERATSSKHSAATFKFLKRAVKLKRPDIASSEKFKELQRKFDWNNRSEQLSLFPATITGKYEVVNAEDQYDFDPIKDELNAGAYGTVYRARVKGADSEQVAIKIIDLEQQPRLELVTREINILSKLKANGRDKNLLLADRILLNDSNEIWIVMKLMEGDLFTLIRKNRVNLNEDQLAYISKQVLEGITVLHSNGIMHRDIKLENVLWNHSGELRLADYGLATEFRTMGTESKKSALKGRKMQHTLRTGTNRLMAPEVGKDLTKSHGMYDEKVDIYSFGLMIFELFHGYLPNSGEDVRWRSYISTVLKDFFKQCLEPDASSRPSANNLLNHEYQRERGASPEAFVSLLSNTAEGKSKTAIEKSAAVAAKPAPRPKAKAPIFGTKKKQQPK